MKRRAARRISFKAVAALILLAAALYSGISRYAADKADAVFSDSGTVPVEYAGETLRLDFIDVGQGDCTLIETPDSKFILIDAGTNAASYKIRDYLNDRGVTEIEYCVFTHPHEDHIGSASLVVENFTVKNVLMMSKAATSSTYERLIDALLESKSKNGTVITEPKPKDVYDVGEVSMEILAADAQSSDANNSSIVIRLTYGDCSFMFTGDAEKQVEKKILSEGADISCVLLKCGHHGSSTSSSKEFIDAVYPAVAVVSCGLDNSYGHPHTEVLSRLNDIGAAVYRTDEMGDIIFECDGKKLYLISTLD